MGERELPDVSYRQVWMDNDPRYRDAGSDSKGRRFLKIIRTPSLDDVARAGRNAGKLKVDVLAWFEKAPTIKRHMKIQLGRFRPTSSGYKLVVDVCADCDDIETKCTCEEALRCSCDLPSSACLCDGTTPAGAML